MKSNAELHNAEQILDELRENIALMRERLETTIQMNAHKIHKNSNSTWNNSTSKEK